MRDMCLFICWIYLLIYNFNLHGLHILYLSSLCIVPNDKYWKIKTNFFHIPAFPLLNAVNEIRLNVSTLNMKNSSRCLLKGRKLAFNSY
jgi:hypothetical protein